MNVEITKKFSAEPDKYYKSSLFDDYNFNRRSCTKCKRFFWTLNENKNLCPEDDEEPYAFIGNPPTNVRLDYTNALREIKSFFAENNHSIINRYPVVCRWREDLYFTIASIVNFQRIINSKIIFELPFNPLLVPQICLRFNDIENVGVTGKHFSSFCMIGQHSVYDSGGYWKDKCIELDFKLLTEKFKISKDEIVFVEDAWEGGGTFGASLEYFVNGLELGNAVFTQFQGTLTKYKKLSQMVIDMGAGLERMSWITIGSPTAYDCCFGNITKKMIQKIGIDVSTDILNKYFKELIKNEKRQDITTRKNRVAKLINISNSDLKNIASLELMYLILDHIRTLIFAFTDGMIPSNMGGGYNLRIIIRKMLVAINKLKVKIDINEIIDEEINYLQYSYPEIVNSRNDIKEIINLERNRYLDSQKRINKVVEKMKISNKNYGLNELVKLYESDGITPDYLKDNNIISSYPSDFYSLLSKKNKPAKKKISKVTIDKVQDTDLLFYKNDPKKFKANVLKVYDRFIILDKTSFYARSGGQEPDHGKINKHNVIDVKKYEKIIVHEVEHKINDIKVGDVVTCSIDIERRKNITKHHTSTHIINSASRKILGNWVWQNSAFKEERYGRLDIIHHSSLTRKEITEIEKISNNVIQQNLPVYIKEYERNIAEQKFGFNIYQGGIMPFKSLRIVDIDGFDVEACGGTHVKRTGEIGLIKIIKTDRIQNGVIRIEFVSGDKAVRYVQEQDNDITNITKLLQTEKSSIVESFKNKLTELEKTKEKLQHIIEKTSQNTITNVIKSSIKLGNLKLYYVIDYNFDEKFHINIGKKSTTYDPSLVYCVLVIKKNVKIIIFSGDVACKTMKANKIAQNISDILGGSSGGNEKFAQGGGTSKSKINTVEAYIKNIK
ncbi:MAG: alanine--tRNA ligase [Thaumarchaeota archaeon]|nr:alanine--tRNA ligase [Nitrososphaerota archaeon]